MGFYTLRGFACLNAVCNFFFNVFSLIQHRHQCDFGSEKILYTVLLSFEFSSLGSFDVARSISVQQVFAVAFSPVAG